MSNITNYELHQVVFRPDVSSAWLQDMADVNESFMRHQLYLQELTKPENKVEFDKIHNVLQTHLRVKKIDNYPTAAAAMYDGDIAGALVRHLAPAVVDKVNEQLLNNANKTEKSLKNKGMTSGSYDPKAFKSLNLSHLFASKMAGWKGLERFEYGVEQVSGNNIVPVETNKLIAAISGAVLDVNVALKEGLRAEFVSVTARAGVLKQKGGKAHQKAVAKSMNPGHGPSHSSNKGTWLDVVRAPYKAFGNMLARRPRLRKMLAYGAIGLGIMSTGITAFQNANDQGAYTHPEVPVEQTIATPQPNTIFQSDAAEKDASIAESEKNSPLEFMTETVHELDEDKLDRAIEEGCKSISLIANGNIQCDSFLMDSTLHTALSAMIETYVRPTTEAELPTQNDTPQTASSVSM